MRFLIAGIAAFLAVLSLLVWGVVGDAWGHDRYEVACCSMKDCAPVDDKIVTERPEGFYLNDNGDFVERSSTKVRKPLDENYHVCRNPAGALLCIYPKLQGM